MCGRYGRRADKQEMAEHYAIRRQQHDPVEHPFASALDYNIAPTMVEPVVRLRRATGERDFAAIFKCHTLIVDLFRFCLVKSRLWGRWYDE
jgi:putative SOS response-associated peptidase YedK